MPFSLRKCLCLIIFLLSCGLLPAQRLQDTVVKLKEVDITIYPSRPLLLSSTASVSRLNKTDLRSYDERSLVPAMNSVAGVRMEERSPGSYRFSVRGSLLRSPFGIRNVKFYLDEFPLTDGGGNTYLNLLESTNMSGIEILKGPEGSMFGANTGGVVLIHNDDPQPDSLQINAGIVAGSYHSYAQNISVDRQFKKYGFYISEGYQHSDGYREQSALDRLSVLTLQRFRYMENNELKVLIFASDLHYETPGGLNLKQFEEDPRAARYSTATLPGAAQQKAGIYNKTGYAGISNSMYLTKSLKHVLVLNGSLTDFKNPFITNYEERKERSAGLRTYLQYDKNYDIFQHSLNIGMQLSDISLTVRNSANDSGTAGMLKQEDELGAQELFYYAQYSVHFLQRINIELAASMNHYMFNFRNIYPSAEHKTSSQKLEPALLPRIAASYKIIPELAARVSASKGYSPPTLAEIRPSTNIIYSGLNPESGWNYEMGLRFRSRNAKIYADAAAFVFELENTIVRRTDTTGAEYFINAGKTYQPGFEAESKIQLYGSDDKFIKSAELGAAYTHYEFRFLDYQSGSNDLSGNRLTGVPENIFHSMLGIKFSKGFLLNLNYHFTDEIPLDDLNKNFAASYQTIGAKLEYGIQLKKLLLSIYVCADNLSDEKYSLGNDLNAAGGRFYNAAPGRNYSAGFKIQL
jgi:iron complex outermembrane receptor protein